MADLGAWATEEYRVPAADDKQAPAAQPGEQHEG
jgi:endogenous inhibitor of DNA gyrase (YacG/DUF329 family)